MNYFTHNIGDFAAATQGLDLEGVGIFIRLLDRFMLTEKPIKTEWVSLGFPQETQNKVSAILEGLFERVDGGWVYEPMLEAIETYQRNRVKNQQNGRKGGRPRKVEPAETHENPRKPIGFATKNQEPITNKEINTPNERKAAKGSSRGEYAKTSYTGLESVSDAMWDDWTKHRKKKRAVVSQRVIDGLASEAKKAGLSLEDAMQVQIERGWAGFKAEWMTSSNDCYVPNSKEFTQEERKKRGYGWTS